ncbi:MAG: hypothetical protein LUC37_00545, partial [Prevotella sp.]|nr:hypothetical protein [Prevotella sp.]
MNREQILGLFDDCDFDNLSEETFEEGIIECLPKDFHFSYAHGVSKCVILPVGEPYVIKIPFIGTYDDYYCYRCSGYSYDEDYEDDDYVAFYEFCNANNDFHHDWDYCFTEALLYDCARKRSINYPFCKTKLIGRTETAGYPIYIQARATPFSETEKRSEHFDRHPTDLEVRSSSMCKEKGVYIFNTTWLTDALAYYGEKIFKRLLQFI